MTCYRGGGCGPYEMYSCSQCPYSKPQNDNKEYKNEKKVKDQMERSDNLKIELLDKSKFLSKWLSEEIEIGSVYIPISINVITYEINELSTLAMPELMSQVKNNAVVWVVKIYE